MKMNGINNVKIKIDEQMKITGFGGYFIVEKMMRQLGLQDLFGTGLGLKVRERDFKETDYINSVIANLMTNGIYVSDIDRLKGDNTFQNYAGFERGIPSGNAVAKYFSKADVASVEKMKFINFETTRRIINEMRKHNKSFGRKIYVFMDSSEIEVTGDQIEGAERNYNGDKSLRIHLIYFEDFIIGGDLYSSSHFVTYGWRELLDNLSKMSDLLESEIHIFMDSAYYDYEIIHYIEEHDWTYTITMKHNESLFENADALDESSWDCDYSELDYYSEKEKRFRRVVVRRIEMEDPDLFGKYNYGFIITNSKESPKLVNKAHSLKMGMENNFKHLLIDFNLHHPRFLSLAPNKLYYQLAILSYNLIKAIQYLYLDGHYFFMRVRRFISHFIMIAGRLVNHARGKIMKLIRYPYDEKRLRRIIMIC